MKLNHVPARQGAAWVRLGIRSFWRQPLAFSGLFFMFMAMVSVASLVPVIGSFLALCLMPAATLGLMAATREVDLGKFPMPVILFSAFRADKQSRRQMMILGLLYALGFCGVMGLSTLVDGGQFARMYLVGTGLDSDTLMKPEFQDAMWLSMLLYVPLTCVFWHAPALVHWHGVPAVKSLFFSTVACLHNWRAMLVYGVMWSLISAGTMLAVMLISNLMGDGQFAMMAMMPAMLILAAMFFCSIYFSFRDSFVPDTYSA